MAAAYLDFSRATNGALTEGAATVSMAVGTAVTLTRTTAIRRTTTTGVVAEATAAIAPGTGFIEPS